MKRTIILQPARESRTIDIWWIIDNGDVLLLIAGIIRQSKEWKKAKIRLFVVLDERDDAKKVEKVITSWLIENRYMIHAFEIISAHVCYYM